ncbi:MAG TPA: VOC family protein [Bryobacteraceae bacterium]|nr:VOC family protein [Bryobacteraceae bacterium]
MANPVLQFQIISKNPEQAAGFYSKLFGWKIDTDNAMGYRRIDTGSAEGIHGGIWPAPEQSPTFTQFFVAVDDVTAMVAKAVKLGARLLIPPTTLPEGDEMAILHDPQGMSFAVWRGKTSDETA